MELELELQNLLMQVKIVKLVYHGEFHTQCQGPNLKLKTIKKIYFIHNYILYNYILYIHIQDNPSKTTTNRIPFGK